MVISTQKKKAKRPSRAKEAKPNGMERNETEGERGRGNGKGVGRTENGVERDGR